MTAVEYGEQHAGDLGIEPNESFQPDQLELIDSERYLRQSSSEQMMHAYDALFEAMRQATDITNERHAQAKLAFFEEGGR